MERLYDQLNDEQKAQRTALGNRHRESKPAASLAQNCTAAQSGLRPVGEIEQALRRTEAQRVSLAELQSTTDGAAELICLEVNTQPGMTETSLVPELAQYAGWSFGELVRWLVEDASCNR